MKKLLKSLLASLLSVLLVLFLFQLILVAQNHIKFNTGFSSPFSIESSSELGWSPKENFNLNYKSKDLTGNVFIVDYQSIKYGFRAYGNIDSQKKKLFFIGDSFTHSRDIETSKTFYGLLSDRYEVFAFGSSGYGTWQEYLVLKKHVDIIKPDLIIWQHHVNDFFDNDYELDKKIGYSGFIFDRPYKNGTRFQENFSLSFLSRLGQLQIFYYLGSRFYNLISKDFSDNAFQFLKENPDELKRASMSTLEALKEFDNFTKNKFKTLHFTVTHDEYFDKKMKELIGERSYIENFSTNVGIKDNGLKVDKLGHWNFKGHKKASTILLPKINKILKK
ncbi:MAG: SGNH/GDSL hydrolase family protein [Bacteriovoracaceae bacterium]|nr:SGNH/GDSL hydrolase family protein [Bacteriovoracaceae bacterium]